MRRDTGFWLALAALVVLAAIPRLLIYDFSLPYIDHPDEGTSYLEARHWRGEYDLGGGHPGYPPGHIAVNYVVQVVVEDLLGYGLTTTTHVMRLFSVMMNLLALVLIAWTARLVAGDAAGLFAGALWGVSPVVVANNVIAIPDPFLYTLTIAACGTAAYALAAPARRVRWGLVSFGVGLAAVVVKYQAFPVLVPGGVVALVVMAGNGRRGALMLAAQATAAGGVAGLLIFGYGALASFGTNRETVAMQQSGLANLLDAGRVLNNLYQAFTPLNAGLVLAVIGAGALAAVVGQRRVAIGPLVPSLPVLVLVPWIASSFALVTAEGSLIRHVMPVTPIVAVLAGVAVAQVVLVLPERWGRVAGWGLPGALALVVVVPAVMTLVGMVPAYRLPDSRVALRQWADLNLDAGTVVVDQSNHKTFNPFWGGISGRQWFDWWVTDDFTTYPVATWRDERGMSYMAIPIVDDERLRATAAGREFLGEMLLLREFRQPPAQRGPEVRFYRTWRMERAVDVAFGEQIRLVGVDAPEAALPGEPLTFRFYWQADAPPPANYSLFLHLVPAAGREPLAQVDGNPARAAERLTMTWTDPSEVIVSGALALAVPPDLAPGAYRVLLGLYDFNTFARLPVAAGDLDDAYEVLRFTVG